MAKSVTVFCGANFGLGDIYKAQATSLGQTLAQKNIKLIYGGACVGLMGALADGSLSAGGTVIGVLPRFLMQTEVAHDGLSELILVDTMHERKNMMHELCDAIITLPGGFGTMEELFEILTWSQLGLHQKPIGLLNVQGYYDIFSQLVANMVQQGFVSSADSERLLIDSNIETLLQKIFSYRAPETQVLLTKEEV